MLTEEQGQELIGIARKNIGNNTKGKGKPSFKEKEYMKKKRGVFVTLNTSSGDLRGCMGLPYPERSLIDSVLRASELVTDDPRFPSLKEEELDDVEIELTVLTEPEEIDISSEEEAKENIDIGREGLIIRGRYGNGLLLPQVAENNGWDEVEFLDHTCRKAGMKKGCWRKKGNAVLKFQGKVFKEKKF